MIANKTLISALRRAADKISNNPTHYNWADYRACNCGLLAEQLIGRPLTTGDYCDIDGHYGVDAAKRQGRRRQRQCFLTGIEMPRVLQSLYAAGMDYKDVAQLEFLRNKQVLDRLGWEVEPLRKKQNVLGYLCIETPRQCNPPNVAAYMRAWADILEEQLTPPVQPVAQQVQHGCAHLFLAGCCVYCSHVQQPELTSAI